MPGMAAQPPYHYVAKYREVHIEDPDLYDLDQLQLLEDNDSKQVKTLGKGGFGSILFAHLPKRIDTHMKPYELLSSLKVQNSVWPYNRFEQMEALEKVDPPHTQVLVAVKRMSECAPELMESLIREASRLRNLWVSRNVVKVYGIVQNQELESPCIVMDIVHGCNINAFMRPYSISSSEFVEAGFSEMDRHNRLIWTLDQTLWWKKKLEIFRELIFSLMLCHNQGIFHGDLKGENVLLDQFLIPKLAKFRIELHAKKRLGLLRIFRWISFLGFPRNL
ncbi:hypothetical protein O6H91_Y179400 [Diphasiastrum complanatum]|nr:hypothetical protein O6H91_Y179400 [Diphasiastrum complanatum]